MGSLWVMCMCESSDISSFFPGEAGLTPRVDGFLYSVLRGSLGFYQNPPLTPFFPELEWPHQIHTVSQPLPGEVNNRFQVVMFMSDLRNFCGVMTVSVCLWMSLTYGAGDAVSEDIHGEWPASQSSSGKEWVQ